MPFYKHEKNGTTRSKKLERLAFKNGCRHLIVDPSGDRYIGEWKNNEKNGKGVLLSKNQTLYEGDFVDNLRNGFGVLAYKIPKLNVFSLLYRGGFKNGTMCGSGICIYKDSFYDGEWKNGRKEGYGQMWYNDGSFYDGDWVNDKRDGLGLWVRADGNRYEGSWHCDMKHGKGRFYFLSYGTLQEGVWYNDSCTFSKVYNLPFRQASVYPTIYPIPPACLINIDNICNIQEERALRGQTEPCFDDADKESTSEDSLSS